MDIICGTHVHVYTLYEHVHAMYVHGTYSAYWFEQVVPTGFHGQHRDAEQRDIPQQSFAREDMEGGSPCPEDGDSSF